MAHRWIPLGLASVVLAACGSAAPAPALEITYTPPPPDPATAPAAVARRRAEATTLVQQYADGHALGDERRAPTAAELAAAALAEVPDPAIDAARWRDLPASERLLAAYLEAQRRLWRAACDAGVAAWWETARRVDGELAAALAATPVPADFYAGMVVRQQQRTWLEARLAAEPALMALPALANAGPRHTILVAQNAWAVAWGARERPLERAISERAVPSNSWALEPLAAEQDRFCTAAYTQGLRQWPPPFGVATIRPGEPPPTAPPGIESATLARITDGGATWIATRRDWQTTLSWRPPCKRVHCTGLDCGMQSGGPWEHVCTQHVTRRHEDHRWVLHVEGAPVTPHVGDVIAFQVEPTTGHAVLVTASKRADRPPYFTLGE